MDETLASQIAAAAADPASASVDGTSVTARPLSELIEADKYLAGKAAANAPGDATTGNGKGGVVFTRFRRGGTR